ncbi:MAG: hypothetical protein OEL85_06700, partial [Desulfobulbaceae bacterium]|nr:hypothetical protein [Desulfobulbaceae bacterium]
PVSPALFASTVPSTETALATHCSQVFADTLKGASIIDKKIINDNRKRNLLNQPFNILFDPQQLSNNECLSSLHCLLLVMSNLLCTSIFAIKSFLFGKISCHRNCASGQLLDKNSHSLLKYKIKSGDTV